MFKFQILIFAAVLMYINADDEFIAVGGSRPEDLKEAEKNLQYSLTQLAAGEGPHYTISKIHSATVQLVSGTLHKYEVDLKNDKGEEKKCNVKIWSQPWMENGDEVTIECDGHEKLVKKHKSRRLEDLN